MHVIIVGAGAIGTCTAYYLSQRDNVRVTVIEKTNVACASSGKAGGFLWSEGDGNLSKKSFQLHADLAATLNGKEFYGYRGVDTYSVTMGADSDGGGDDGSDTTTTTTKKTKVNDFVPWLNQQRVTHCDELGSKRDTAQVHPYLFSMTVMTAAVATGNVTLKTGVGVQQLLYDNSKDQKAPQQRKPTVTGVVLEDGTKIEADRVVLCLGPWSQYFHVHTNASSSRSRSGDDGDDNDDDDDMKTRHHLTKPGEKEEADDDGDNADDADDDGKGGGLPVLSMRAHSIVMRVPKSSPIGAQALFTSILHQSKQYEPEIYPRPDHTVYICGRQDSSVPLPASADLIQVDPQAIALLKELAKGFSSHLVPNDDLMVAEQACYLPHSRDGSPLVGQHPLVHQLYASCGHSVWGILLAPVSGLMMSELLMEGAITCVDASLVNRLALDGRLD